MADVVKVLNDAKDDGVIALLLLMDLVATAAKKNEPLAEPFLRLGAITIMPDGIALYHSDQFREAMREMIGKMVGI